MFNPDQLVEAKTKVVTSMTMKESLKTSQGTQYKGTSSYVGRPRQPQLAHGSDGMLDPKVSCKDTGHTKDNCVWLNNKIAYDIQLQEQLTVAKLKNKKGTRPYISNKLDLLRSWTNLEEIRSAVQTNLKKQHTME